MFPSEEADNGMQWVVKERAMVANALTGPFQLPVYFDYPATFVWALSGGLLAAQLRLDPTGVSIIALVTAAGGDLLRDGLFLNVGPPALLRTPIYIILIAIATLIVVVAGPLVLRIPFFDHIVDLIDVFGLGAYAIVGLQLSLSLGLSAPAAVFVGTVNSVGGGLLRDILLRRTPELLQPGSPEGIVATRRLARRRRRDRVATGIAGRNRGDRWLHRLRGDDESDHVAGSARWAPGDRAGLRDPGHRTALQPPDRAHSGVHPDKPRVIGFRSVATMWERRAPWMS
jgi:uncharacterized membrane protein YeiH